ncbi:MAG: hypothetical protein A3E87_06270 [Gammaproteobacteria bacterium RIFCSPHIGHO2_12_FULL_35_23]|nr:MAG: hypothetical protein A3E87_06270 [Gammaproteobacteria bacterium RIFCSPHIGHO2_12_FULL_35_23]
MFSFFTTKITYQCFFKRMFLDELRMEVLSLNPDLWQGYAAYDKDELEEDELEKVEQAFIEVDRAVYPIAIRLLNHFENVLTKSPKSFITLEEFCQKLAEIKEIFATASIKITGSNSVMNVYEKLCLLSHAYAEICPDYPVLAPVVELKLFDKVRLFVSRKPIPFAEAPILKDEAEREGLALTGEGIETNEDEDTRVDWFMEGLLARYC